MGEQGVDEARLRREMTAQLLRAAAVAGDFVQEPLELRDVAVDRLLEVAVGAVLAGDLVEGLLAGRRIEPLAEGLVLAALVAIPHFGGEVAVHQPADVERQRLQRIAAALRGLWLLRAATRRLASSRSALAGIGAVQQVGQPAVTALVAARGRDRRGLGTSRGGHAEVRR